MHESSVHAPQLLGELECRQVELLDRLRRLDRLMASCERELAELRRSRADVRHEEG